MTARDIDEVAVARVLGGGICPLNTDETRDLVEIACRRGLHDGQIAELLDVSRDLVHAWRHGRRAYRPTLQDGRLAPHKHRTVAELQAERYPLDLLVGEVIRVGETRNLRGLRPCGTWAAVARHRAAHEKLDAACLATERAYRAGRVRRPQHEVEA